MEGTAAAPGSVNVWIGERSVAWIEVAQQWWRKGVAQVTEQNGQRVGGFGKSYDVPFEGGAKIDVVECVLDAFKALELKNPHWPG